MTYIQAAGGGGAGGLSHGGFDVDDNNATTDMVSFWPLNEHITSGFPNAHDEAGYRPLSYASGTFTWLQTGGPGGQPCTSGADASANPALGWDKSLTAEGDDGSNNNAVDFWMMFRVYCHDVSANNVLWSHWNSGTNDRGVLLQTSAGGIPVFYVSATGTSAVGATSTVTLTNNTWATIICGHDSTASGNELFISVNNETLVTTSHGTGVRASTRSVGVLYHEGGGTDHLNGRACDVMYNIGTTPSAAVRTDLHNSGSGNTYRR